MTSSHFATAKEDAPLVLVTGASGYIAGFCVSELQAHGYRVRGTVRSPSKAKHLSGVQLWRAELDSDHGWAEAVAGCDYVLHVASPFPAHRPADDAELVTPAVEGTLRVLRACARSGSVKRVVLTSSLAAVRTGHRSDETLTEQSWSDVRVAAPYPKSKTLAERAAWDFARRDGTFELAAVNPGMVLGPVQRAGVGTSMEPLRRLLARDMPALPRIGWATVDVRDLATAHRLAMELPAAAGNRYICAGEQLWLRDMARILRERYRVTTRQAPRALLRVLARFDPAVDLILPDLGRVERVSAEKARRELGWTMRPVRETLFDTAASLTEFGLVPGVARARRDAPVPRGG